jgi:hypothetical protein
MLCPDGAAWSLRHFRADRTDAAVTDDLCFPIQIVSLFAAEQRLEALPGWVWKVENDAHSHSLSMPPHFSDDC